MMYSSQDTVLGALGKKKSGFLHHIQIRIPLKKKKTLSCAEEKSVCFFVHLIGQTAVSFFSFWKANSVETYVHQTPADVPLVVPALAQLKHANHSKPFVLICHRHFSPGLTSPFCSKSEHICSTFSPPPPPFRKGQCILNRITYSFSTRRRGK